MAAMKAGRIIKEMPDVKCLLGCAPIASQPLKNRRVATTSTRACQRIADGKTPHAADMSAAARKCIVSDTLCFSIPSAGPILGIASSFCQRIASRAALCDARTESATKHPIANLRDEKTAPHFLRQVIGTLAGDSGLHPDSFAAVWIKAPLIRSSAALS